MRLTVTPGEISAEEVQAGFVVAKVSTIVNKGRSVHDTLDVSKERVLFSRAVEVNLRNMSDVDIDRLVAQLRSNGYEVLKG